MKKIILSLNIFLFLSLAGIASAHQPRIIYSQAGDINIIDPELSQAFYDDLKGKPRDYFIDSNKSFELYINLLVPNPANQEGKYSARVFLMDGAPSGSQEKQIAELDAGSVNWQGFYEPFGRDYYLKGPELDETVPAGKYKIEVYSADNKGEYVLAVGKKEMYDIKALLNAYWQLPLLKINFFKTPVWQFFFTLFGIGGVAVIGALLIFLALIYYFIGLIKQTIKHNRAKTLLLTSNGMQMRNEIVKLLQKPAYDVNVAFITTAAKPEENLDYVKKDWAIMKEELGFNVEEIDIEGKKEHELLRLLEVKDIIYVEGGNTFYLLKAMRECNFEKVIRALMKDGKVYIGASAGTIVAGRTIKTAGWKNGDRDIVHLKNLKGLNLVPFDIFVHYLPEHAEIIKKQMPWVWLRKRRLKILTDDQAILVQGREVDLIGKGEAIII